MTETHLTIAVRPPGAASAPVIRPGLEWLFAAAAGAIVLPLYAPQPLVDLIGPSLGLSPRNASLVAMTPMLGYATGLVLLVPLIDVVENRRAILLTLVADVVALAGAAAASSAAMFLLAAFAAGCATSAIQMIVPVTASLVDETRRGRTIGNVMSGLMIGILLSRPIASLAAAAAGWRGAYALDAVAVAATAVVLQRMLPQRRPSGGVTYATLIASLLTLLAEQPVLRRRALYQALCMGAFGIFWTTVALQLAASPFGLDRAGIALFALAGIGGAVSAPIAGRAGDHGWTTPATRVAHASVIAAMLLAGAAGAGRFGFDPSARPGLSLGVLAVAAIVLDLGVIGDQTLGRRAINLACPQASGRLNGLYTGLFFVGGAAGSASGSIVWVEGGWTLVCVVGAVFGVMALALASILRSPDDDAHSARSGSMILAPSWRASSKESSS
ncbi:MAG: MFS transporter [Bradyrhizobium sp.]|nr:MFS transporter [Bradyrhizobium sp.]